MNPAPYNPGSGIVIPEENPITKEMIAGFAGRRWLIVLLVFLGTVAGTYCVLSLMTEKYETESKIIVKLGRENVDPPATARGNVLVTGLRLQDAANEIQILRSSELLGQVVDEVGIEAFRAKPAQPTSLAGWAKYYVKSAVKSVKRGYDEALIALDLKKRLGERELAIETVREGTQVELEKDTDVIGIRTRLPDYTLSEKIQRSMIAVYLARRGGVRQDDGVREFLDAETQEARRSLAQIEGRIQDLKGRKSITSLQEQQSLLLRELRDLTSASIQTRTEIAGLEQQAQELRSRIAETPREIRASQQEVPNPLVNSLRERLVNLRAQLSTTSNKYQPDSVVVVNLRKEIADLEAQLQAETSTRPGTVTYEVNPLRQSLEKSLQETAVALAGARSKLEQQSRSLDQLRRELRELDAAQGTLQDAERTRVAEEERYLNLVKKRQAAHLDSELLDKRISNVNVLQQPASTPAPVYPRKLLIFYISLGVGLLLGVIVALIVEYLDPSVRDARRAELILQAPCLGVVGYGAGQAGSR
jgi:uncharacterized protein involved in exopolysaccharide biosynthesis